MANDILIVAGEPSGDLHASALMKEINKLSSEIKFLGIGGNYMKAEGLNILYHIEKLSFLGFTEVLRHIPFIRKVQNEIITLVKERNIRFAILIDYPGFNLNLAKKLSRLNVKIFYYISPQVWAWGEKRIEKIKNLVSKMIVVFPFEEEMYKKHGVDAVFVGHPLIERLEQYNYLTKEELYNKLQLEPKKEILLVLPGSRKHEVKKIFPITMNAAEKLSDKYQMQVIVCAAENISESFLKSVYANREFKIVKGYNYDLMKYAKFAIVKSGTSTLETALFSIPMLIVYKTTFLTYIIGKSLVKIKNIGMVNILAGKTIVPEFIQKNATVEKLFNAGDKILGNSEGYKKIKNELELIREKLGEKKASVKCAEIILSEIKNDK